MTHAANDTMHKFAEAGLGNSSYLVDVGSGMAVVIDPPRDVSPHVGLAERLGLDVVAAIETHLHADFISGSRELADAVGAEILAPTASGLAFDHRAIDEADPTTFGAATIRALHTPGHTPEHMSYLIERGGRSAVFTGGSLIAGGAARTDLIDAGMTVQLARAQFHSLRRLAGLPGDTLLFPTHGAGSFCSAPTVASGATTIADERLSNPLLEIDDEDAFVEAFLEGFGSFPPYFLRLRDVNRAGPKLTRDLDSAVAMTSDDVRGATARGAWLIDARPFEQWARAHLPGSISVELRPAFASWLGWVVPFGRPVVVVIEEDRLDDVLRSARAIGYDRIIGWTPPPAGAHVETTDVVDAEEATRRAAEGAALIDVRQRAEVERMRVPGAVHLELGEIIAGRDPRGAHEVVTFCGHGERAATAASLLLRNGGRVAVLSGGPGDLAAHASGSQATA